MPRPIPILLTDLFNASELALCVRADPCGEELVNTVVWTGSYIDTCHQIVDAFERRGDLDAFKALLLEARPNRAADIHRIFNAHLRGSARRGGEDAMPSPSSNEIDLNTYYSLNEVDQRARRAFDNRGMLLVRDSQDWAAARGLPLPLVVERQHLAAREVFGAAEMAILLLLRPPRLQVLARISHQPQEFRPHLPC